MESCEYFFVLVAFSRAKQDTFSLDNEFSLMHAYTILINMFQKRAVPCGQDCKRVVRDLATGRVPHKRGINGKSVRYFIVAESLSKLYFLYVQFLSSYLVNISFFLQIYNLCIALYKYLIPIILNESHWFPLYFILVCTLLHTSIKFVQDRRLLLTAPLL